MTPNVEHAPARPRTNGAPLSSIRLNKMPAAQRNAIKLLGQNRLRRVRNGWKVPGEAKRISLETGRALCDKGLAADLVDERAQRVLRLTGAGRTILQVLRERARR